MIIITDKSIFESITKIKVKNDFTIGNEKTYQDIVRQTFNKIVWDSLNKNFNTEIAYSIIEQHCEL